MLTVEQMAYGQQKNREYIWRQAKLERWEYKQSNAILLRREIEPWNELDEDMTGVRYEQLCLSANITPW